ncbi:MAG: DNA repair protein RecO [Candidatus Cloacimonetes bacterium]|nr:DNA repair protein RecO [Candidatus Cloacimonadota bacterium]
MTYKSRAIVLHKEPFKESSYIVKLMTDTSGVISAIVQGARRSKSPFFSQYELGNCLEVVLLKKNSSNLYLISDSSLLKYLDITKQTFAQILSIQCVLEIFLQLTISEEESDEFFNLLLTFLEYIPSVRYNHLLIIWRFLVRLTEMLGFPIMYQLEGKYILYESVRTEVLNETLNHHPPYNNRHYSHREHNRNIHIQNIERNPLEINIEKWVNILSTAGKYIKGPDILDESCLQINKLLFDWFSKHLNKKIHCNSLNLYEEDILKKYY